jgi:hypothetical protein
VDDGGDDSNNRCGCGTASFTPSGLWMALALTAALFSLLAGCRS